MTDSTSIAPPLTDDADRFEPSGHPVRRAVFFLFVLVILIAALWWSALAAPRLEFSSGSGSYDELTGEGSSTISVRNDGPLDVTVVGVAPVDNDQEFRLAERVEIPAGGEAQVAVEVSIDCSEPIVNGQVPFELIVETAIGIERRASDAFMASVTVPNCPAPG